MQNKARSGTRWKILEYIERFYDERGYPPSVRDIRDGCKISTTSVVQYHLEHLERDGLIKRDARVFRGIRLKGTGAVTERAVPLLGTIAAGEPIPVPTADTWHIEYLEKVAVPGDLLKGKNEVFALKVRGSSMIDALISDGDIVILEPAGAVNDGDTVAVWLKDRQEVTLKKIYREKGTVRLQPANINMSPIFVSPENVEVQGKVIGVIRIL